MMNYTDFQPYILPETDVWALPTQKAMELLEYLENKGMKQVICVPPVRQENPNNTTENLKNLKSATPFPKCYLHKEKWTFDS